MVHAARDVKMIMATAKRDFLSLIVQIQLSQRMVTLSIEEGTMEGNISIMDRDIPMHMLSHTLPSFFCCFSVTSIQRSHSICVLSNTCTNIFTKVQTELPFYSENLMRSNTILMPDIAVPMKDYGDSGKDIFMSKILL